MDDALAVRLRERPGELHEQVADYGRREAIGVVDGGLQVAAADVLHGDGELVGVVREVVEDADDARVVELRQQRGFEHRPFHAAAGVHHFEGDGRVGGVAVGGAVDDAERPAAELPLDPVRPDRQSAGHVRHATPPV